MSFSWKAQDRVNLLCVNKYYEKEKERSKQTALVSHHVHVCIWDFQRSDFNVTQNIFCDGKSVYGTYLN